MILEKIGDILSIGEGVIVHGCNAQGKMNSGIAKQVRKDYPEAYLIYMDNYRSGLGSISYYSASDKKIIVNGITQEFYGRDPSALYVSYDAMFTVFDNILRDDFLRKNAERYGLNFPLIGCGLANGDWSIVREIIDQAIPESIKKTLWILE